MEPRSPRVPGKQAAARGHLLTIGAPRAGGTGRAYVYRVDKDTAQYAFEIKGDASSRNLGQYFVAILRDCDGDGYEDVYASDWNNNGAAPGGGARLRPLWQERQAAV